jgi:cytochrome d ubiquinol oxidase subunit II
VSLPQAVIVVVWLGVTAYAVFGGADFGGGLWDLAAGRTVAAGRRRRLIEESIAPVWEANHVWLIFVVVFLWTGFPAALTSLMTTLSVPLGLVLVGIIARGAGFVFRKSTFGSGDRRRYGAAFSASSTLTPFFLGAAAGGVASGRVPPGDGAGDRWTSWLNPTSLVGGGLAVAVCAFLAATFLAWEADQRSERELTEWFRSRAIAAGGAAGAVAIGGVVPLRADARRLFDGLTAGWGTPLVVASMAGGVAALWSLWRRRYAPARLAAVLAVVAVIWGWGAAQYPYLLVDELTVAEAAAARASLWALLVAFAVAAGVAVPSLVYLYLLAGRGLLRTGGERHVESSSALLERLRAEHQPDSADAGAGPTPDA